MAGESHKSMTVYGLPGEVPRVFGRADAKSRHTNITSALFSAVLAIALAALGFSLHLSLSAAEPLELLLVLVIALRLGLLQASVASVVAALCLDFLFTQPLYTFTVADPQNWISLLTFETIALSVSSLSTRVRLHAAEAEEQRKRALTLYELSRAILYVQQGRPTAEQLSPLIRELLGVETVAFWITTEGTSSEGYRPSSGPLHTAYEAYLLDRNVDDVANRCSSRSLRLGVTAIGGMTLQGWQPDPLMADAVASLAALAFERARANRRESRAEIAREAEQLRTAVLDGLAHGFKTPLTAILTASSGLLAVGNLSGMQSELISLIDDRATMLSQLTTQLLQTAALDAKEIRLHRTEISLADLVNGVVWAQSPDVQARIVLQGTLAPSEDDVDAPLFELALQQLVDNANKYSAPDTPITISVKQDKWETVVSVINVGRADFLIQPEETTKIFDRFYRGIRDEYGPAGTGLGLSVVKKIAEAHGGRAWVECSDGTARFSLGVPRLRGGTHG